MYGFPELFLAKKNGNRKVHRLNLEQVSFGKRRGGEKGWDYWGKKVNSNLLLRKKQLAIWRMRTKFTFTAVFVFPLFLCQIED